jgi:signal transduction histidine kinase
VTPLDELFAFVGFDDADRAQLRELQPPARPAVPGLGMSIVHSLIALHGGAIERETGPRGTTFEVILPRWR